MSDLVLSTGERVPELADTCTVFEDGPWRLVRRETAGRYRLEQWQDRWVAKGTCMANHPARGWWVYTITNGTQAAVYSDLDEAIGALWAARGTA